MKFWIRLWGRIETTNILIDTLYLDQFQAVITDWNIAWTSFSNPLKKIALQVNVVIFIYK